MRAELRAGRCPRNSTGGGEQAAIFTGNRGTTEASNGVKSLKVREGTAAAGHGLAKEHKPNRTLMAVKLLGFEKPLSLAVLGGWDDIQQKYRPSLPDSSCRCQRPAAGQRWTQPGPAGPWASRGVNSLPAAAAPPRERHFNSYQNITIVLVFSFIFQTNLPYRVTQYLFSRYSIFQ